MICYAPIDKRNTSKFIVNWWANIGDRQILKLLTDEVEWRMWLINALLENKTESSDWHSWTPSGLLFFPFLSGQVGGPILWDRAQTRMYSLKQAGSPREGAGLSMLSVFSQTHRSIWIVASALSSASLVELWTLDFYQEQLTQSWKNIQLSSPCTGKMGTWDM